MIDDQIRSVVERILRLKAEQDDIGDAIKDVYAEAKGNGLDKTQLGKVVAYARQREKRGATTADAEEATFALYLNAYLGQPSHTHASAREAA